MTVNETVKFDKNDLHCTAEVTLPAMAIQQPYDQRMTKFISEARVAGFRAGHMPRWYADREYGEDVVKEVFYNELLDKSLKEVYEMHQVEAATQPAVDQVHLKLGDPVSYMVKFECFPAVDIPDVSKDGIENPQVEVMEDDLDGLRQQLRERHTEWLPVKRKAQNGDRISCTISADDQDSTVAKKYVQDDKIVVLGEGLEGFDKSLAAVLAGTKSAQSHTLSYADQDADEVMFTVQVTAVESATLPEYDLALIQKEDEQCEDVAAYEESLKSSLRQQCQVMREKLIKHRVSEWVEKNCQFDVPESMLANEKKLLMQSSGVGEESAVKTAQKNVRFSLFLRQVVKANALEVDSERLREYIGYVFEGYDPRMAMQWLNSDSRNYEQFAAVVLEQQAAECFHGQFQLSDTVYSLKSASEIF